MEKLPAQYKDLLDEKGPLILIEALKLYGIREIVGPQHNATILAWADEVNATVGEFVKDDEQPWCALFMSVVEKRAGWVPPAGFDAIRAKSHAKWGDPIAGEPMLGDVLIFGRDGGGHVGIYVGEDKTHFHVLGGNQGNMVCISRISRDRLITARRSPINSCPAYIRRIFRAGNGNVTTNEA